MKQGLELGPSDSKSNSSSSLSNWWQYFAWSPAVWGKGIRSAVFPGLEPVYCAVCLCDLRWLLNWVFVSLCIKWDYYCLLCTVQFSSVQSLSPVWLCDPKDRSAPGLPVIHQLLEFTQTHVHRVGDAIQPSHPRSSPSPPAPNPSQHLSLFQWVNSSHEVAKVLEFQL